MRRGVFLATSTIKYLEDFSKSISGKNNISLAIRVLADYQNQVAKIIHSQGEAIISTSKGAIKNGIFDDNIKKELQKFTTSIFGKSNISESIRILAKYHKTVIPWVQEDRANLKEILKENKIKKSIQQLEAS